MLCPHCLNPLKLITKPIKAMGCLRCGGRWHSFKTFQDKVGNDKAFQELLYVAHQSTEKGKVCPSCKKNMKPLRTPQNSTPLDVCFTCSHIWFDFAEYENFKGRGEQLGEIFLKMRASQQPLTINGIRVDAFTLDYFERFADPRLRESDVQSTYKIKGFPFISYLAIAICFVVFLKFRNNVEHLWEYYAFHLGDSPLANLRTLFTCFFVHASWAHLLGNMYFMYLMSLEAEDASTPTEFLTVLFGGHVLGTILQAKFSAPGTYIAGASAGVFSVLVYYSILFPKARMQSLIPFRGRFRRYETTYVRLNYPIQLFVVGMIIQEVAFTYMGDKGVAHLAHLGGAAVGAIVGLTRKNRV